MRQISSYITCILVFLFLTLGGFAQHSPDHNGTAHHSHSRHGGSAAAAPHVTLNAAVDKQDILIGQPVRLTLEATVQGNASISWPVLDSFPHFEWVEKGNIDSVIRPDGKSYRQYLTITSFDSGTWAIPRLPFIAGDKEFLSDSLRIKVDFSKFDPSKDYHDIKDIIDVPNPFARWISWIVGVATLLSLAIVIWLIRKRRMLKQRIQTVQAPPLSPYEEAIRRLDELEKEGLAEKGPAKTYYTRLNDILRLFVLRRLGIASLVETNEELIGQLRQLPLAPEQFASLAETLRMSDFVKFAKYQPGLIDNEHNFRVIRSSIDVLNNLSN